MSSDYNFPKEIRKEKSLQDLSLYMSTLGGGPHGPLGKKKVITALSKRAILLAHEEAKKNPYEAKKSFAALKVQIDKLKPSEGNKPQTLFTRIFGPPLERALHKLGKLVISRDNRINKLYIRLDQIGRPFGYIHDDEIFKDQPLLFLKTLQAQLQKEPKQRLVKRKLSLIQNMVKLNVNMQKPSENVLNQKLDQVLEKMRIIPDKSGEWKKNLLEILPFYGSEHQYLATTALTILDLLGVSKKVTLEEAVSKQGQKIKEPPLVARVQAEAFKAVSGDSFSDATAVNLKQDLDYWQPGVTKIPLNNVAAFLNQGGLDGNLEDRASYLYQRANTIYEQGHKEDAFNLFYLTLSVVKRSFTLEDDIVALPLSDNFKGFIRETIKNKEERGRFFPR